jgi:hypothetical protein
MKLWVIYSQLPLLNEKKCFGPISLSPARVVSPIPFPIDHAPYSPPPPSAQGFIPDRCLPPELRWWWSNATAPPHLLPIVDRRQATTSPPHRRLVPSVCSRPVHDVRHYCLTSLTLAVKTAGCLGHHCAVSHRANSRRGECPRVGARATPGSRASWAVSVINPGQCYESMGRIRPNHCSPFIQFPNSFPNLNSRKSFKLQKFIENKIKLRQIQNKLI